MRERPQPLPDPACRAARARWRRSLVAAVLLLVAAGVPALAAGADPAPARYALIINGDDSFTHNRNVEIALAALSKLGYPAANTFLLSANPRPPEGGGAVLRPASKHALAATLAALKERMRPGDLLVVYLTGHGIRFLGHPVLALESGTIGPGALARDVSALAFDQLILVADQCYSGAFAKAFVALGRNVVAVSSTDDSHEVRCEPFVRPFWAAAVDADAASSRDASGRPQMVSVEEAFRVAAASLGAGVAPAAGAQYVVSGACKGRSNFFSATPRP